MSLWVSAGLCGFPQVVSAGLHMWSLWVVVGKINQSKSVPMMSLNVVGNIDQSNSRHLHRWSLWVVSVGLRGWSPWVVSAGSLCGSLQVVSMGGLCR